MPFLLAHMRIKILVYVLSFFIPSLTLAESFTVRGSVDEYPATYMRNGVWQGMDIEVIRELSHRANLEILIKDLPFQRSLIEIQKGQLHLIPNLVKNDERSVYMEWLGPTRVTCIGLVVQEKDLSEVFKTTDELIEVAKKHGKKLGYLSGASYSPYMDKRLKSDTSLQDVIHYLPDSQQHRQMLQLGRIFGYFYDAFEIQQRLSDDSFSNEFEGLALHSYRIEESCTGAYIGMSKKLGKDQQQSLINAFESMQQDGTFSKIHRQWVGTEPSFHTKGTE